MLQHGYNDLLNALYCNLIGTKTSAGLPGQVSLEFYVNILNTTTLDCKNAIRECIQSIKK